MTLKNDFTAETQAQPVLTHTVSLTHELVLSDKSLGLTEQQQQAIKSVLKAYALAAKNIKNSTLFIIKNLQSAYQYVPNEAYQKSKKSEKEENQIPKGFYRLKSKLHDNQQQLIDLTNQAVMELNQEQINKFEKNKTKKKTEAEESTNEADYQCNNPNQTDNSKEKCKDKDKEPKVYQSFVNTISISAYGQTFNKTLVERIIKLKEQANLKYVDYSEVHSHLAQGVLQKVCDDFSHYIKALVAYQEKPKEFTGRPQTPQYLGKHDGATFEFHALRWPNNGHLLNVMKSHKLYHDFKKKNKVSPEEIAIYNQIDFKALIEKSIQTSAATQALYAQYGQNLSLASIRVMPCQVRTPKGFIKSIKIAYVINVQQKLGGFFPALQAKSMDMFEKDFFKLKSRQTHKVLKDYFNQDFVTLQTESGGNIVPGMAMIDCGLTNFCTVSYFTGNQKQDINSHVQDVISGQDLKNKMAKFARQIDRIKSASATPAYKDICAKRDKKEALTKAELIAEKAFYQDLYTNPNLVKCYEKRKNLTLDFVHRLSKAIVTKTHAKGIGLIVVGKNVGWKQEVNMGVKNNQWMHDFPHAQFIEILTYNALMKNIVVVKQEESYTSQTCFINNEVMKVKADKHLNQQLNKEMKQKENQTTVVQQKAVSDTMDNQNVSHKVDMSRGQSPHHNSRPKQTALSGKRNSTVYTTAHFSRQKGDFKIKVHADVHGSLNIGRKFISRLNFDYLGHNMAIFKFKVKRLAKRGKLGLTDLKY